jgi:hypothetical protein
VDVGRKVALDEVKAAGGGGSEKKGRDLAYFVNTAPGILGALAEGCPCVAKAGCCRT